MKKFISSTDYAELSGLGIALVALSLKEHKTDQEVIVEDWIKKRLVEIKNGTSD